MKRRVYAWEMNKDPRSQLDTSDVLAPSHVINKNLFLYFLADSGAAVFREQEMVSPHSANPSLKLHMDSFLTGNNMGRAGGC